MGDAGEARGASSARDAWLALRLFALAPHALGGVSLRAGAGPVRDRWLADLRAALDPAAPWRPCPLHIDLDRLLGGIDLAATLQAGRSVAQRGLLAEADGGVVVLAMAERTGESTVAHLAAALDRGEVAIARDGIEACSPARFGVVALDEGTEAEEGPRAALLDRLAFHVDLDAVSMRDLAVLDAVAGLAGAAEPSGDPPSVSELSDALLEALCAAAMALGAVSIRASVFAARVARLLAALDGRAEATAEDASAAARLVLGPRATRQPVPPSESDADESQDPAPADQPVDSSPETRESEPSSDAEENDATDPNEPRSNLDDDDPGDDAAAANDLAGDVVLAAASAAIPAGLLARLAAGGMARGARAAAGRAGAAQSGTRGGRPAGVRRERPRGGARLDLIATLRAAAPWQRVREREAGAKGGAMASAALRVRVRADDFHVSRRIQRGRTVTIFAVDASGSSALQRLAEAKGAVELLLAECYVRRDSVAVIAFRGRGSELLLPPTRSLVRAKRSLAELPGGGGTPLAAGIDAALALALSVQRKGDTPVVVVLTDGRANVARSGSGGRAGADADALQAARALATSGLNSLLIDTSPQPQAKARELAVAMRAHYLPLPYAGADALSDAVRSVAHGEPMRAR